MLSITHAAVGGAVGTFFSNPVLAFGAGIISHLIVDKIPHFWPKEKVKQDRQIVIDAIGTILLLFLICIFTFQKNNAVFWGSLGGASVDFILVVVAKKKKEWWNHPVRVWHEDRQPHRASVVYLFTDIIQTIIGLAIIYFVR